MPLHIGADFHRAMVATAAGEKLLIGRRPVRNWTRRTISSLFSCRKLHLFLEKSTKTVATRAALFHSNMYQIKSFVGTGGAYSAPRLPSCIWGLTSKGKGRERERGSSCFAHRKKTEKSAPSYVCLCADFRRVQGRLPHINDGANAP